MKQRRTQGIGWSACSALRQPAKQRPASLCDRAPCLPSGLQSLARTRTVKPLVVADRPAGAQAGRPRAVWLLRRPPPPDHRLHPQLRGRRGHALDGGLGRRNGRGGPEAQVVPPAFDVRFRAGPRDRPVTRPAGGCGLAARLAAGKLTEPGHGPLPSSANDVDASDRWPRGRGGQRAGTLGAGEFQTPGPGPAARVALTRPHPGPKAPPRDRGQGQETRAGPPTAQGRQEVAEGTSTGDERGAGAAPIPAAGGVEAARMPAAAAAAPSWRTGQQPGWFAAGDPCPQQRAEAAPNRGP